MERRQLLATTGSLAGFACAGCLGSVQGDQGVTQKQQTDTPSPTPTTRSLEGTLTVATYSSFVNAPSSSPGPWIKKAFESRYPNVTLQWTTPENALNHYIQRRSQNAPIDADVYVGLKVPEIVRINQKLSRPLFAPNDIDQLSNFEHVGAEYSLDPENRVLPVFTGYQSFVYNGYQVDEPQTLDALTEDQYQGKLTVQNAQTDNTGLYFLLWTVKEKGEDGYLDYWRELVANDVAVLQSWSEVYNAFTSGETPLITSFSTDQVFAKRAEQDLKKHQVAFPGGHGYTNLSGMGKFATSDQSELATAFLNFMLSPAAQGKLAELNVSFPVTDNASVPSVFEQYAKKPPEPLFFTTDELQGNLQTWLSRWAQVIAGQ